MSDTIFWVRDATCSTRQETTGIPLLSGRTGISPVTVWYLATFADNFVTGRTTCDRRSSYGY
jgi:hypothetical protein